MPALKTAQADPHTALKEGGRGASGTRHRAQSVFVVAEIAMALVLLIGAGLMVRSLTRLWSVGTGFNPGHLLTFGYTLPPSMIHANPEAIRSAYRDFDDKLAATPGVKAVSQSWGGLPMSMNDDEEMFWMGDRPKPANDNGMDWALNYVVGPDYLKTMGIPLQRGRFFTAQDDEKSPLTGVIDDVFARKFFPNQDPIGKRIVLKEGSREVEIIGIVGHVKQWGLDTDDTYPLRAELYLAWMQMPDSFVSMAPSGISAVVRFEGSAASASSSIRRAIGQMSNEQIIYDMQTMESLISDSLAERRFAMVLLGAFAVLALLLASVGIYGVIAYVVGQRTQEIGIRMALGAERKDVLRMVLWEGLRLALVGVLTGTVAALLLTRFMAKMLYGVSASDPLTFCGLAILLAAVAIAACYIPARRAASIEPMQALRTE
jgi:predicted permease